MASAWEQTLDEDQRFMEQIARENAEARATVSVSEALDGPSGRTIRLVRAMADGTKRAQVVNVPHGHLDIMGHPDFRHLLYRDILADYWASSRAKIFRHFGVAE